MLDVAAGLVCVTSSLIRRDKPDHPLLIGAAIAVAVSLVFRHNTLLGGVLPVVALVLVRSQLLKRMVATP